MGQFSLTHLLLIAIIALIFFGPSRLPQLGQGLGRAIKGFKDGLNGNDEDSRTETRSVGSNAPDQLKSPGAAPAQTNESKQKDPNQQG